MASRTFIVFLSLCAFLALSGCASLHNSTTPAPLKVSLNASLHANIAVGGKITGKAVKTKLLHLFTLSSPTRFADGVTFANTNNSSLPFLSFLGSNNDALKSAAAQAALDNSGADLVIAPHYIVTEYSNFFFQKIVVQVDGYAGFVKGVTPTH